jgi:arsenate reductase
MAEALLKSLGGDRFEVHSAGIEPGTLNPLAVTAMKAIGIDISSNLTKSVFDYYKDGSVFDYVITVCDETSGERCPVFPGITKRMHWSFSDPSSFAGSAEEKLEKTVMVREQILTRLKSWLKTLE